MLGLLGTQEEHASKASLSHNPFIPTGTLAAVRDGYELPQGWVFRPDITLRVAEWKGFHANLDVPETPVRLPRLRPAAVPVGPEA